MLGNLFFKVNLTDLDILKGLSNEINHAKRIMKGRPTESTQGKKAWKQIFIARWKRC